MQHMLAERKGYRDTLDYIMRGSSAELDIYACTIFVLRGKSRLRLELCDGCYGELLAGEALLYLLTGHTKIDVDFVGDDPSGWTPLMFSIDLGDVSAVELLLEVRRHGP